ncbi:hypothetical protein BaRGS_00000776 [Batillaria attramentaria]|uniref:Uncharacterized protein n=1 Tax=Batillaria attramentaria TaxID=370345 RepID=A0ABD0M8V3_9CAEN
MTTTDRWVTHKLIFLSTQDKLREPLSTSEILDVLYALSCLARFHAHVCEVPSVALTPAGYQLVALQHARFQSLAPYNLSPRWNANRTPPALRWGLDSESCGLVRSVNAAPP